LRGIRAYFADHGYLEVETLIRIPAPAPENTIDADFSGELFWLTSPELQMKRLLSSGYSRIFQICKCFRQAERGSRHLPEFTMFEWYCSKSNYVDMIAECEELIRFVASRTGLEDFILYHGETIDLRLPWEMPLPSTVW
jgi:lysyl-tRNA synthetase class 2